LEDVVEASNETSVFKERRSTMEQQFEHLFTPIKIGNVTVPNRIMMPAHVPRFYPPVLPPDETYINYLEARAKGGAGVIVVSANMPSWPTTRPFHTAFEDDSVIPVLKGLADTLHQHGAKVFGQLLHAGAFLSSREVGGGSTVSASSLAWESPFVAACQEVTHEADIDDIKRFEDDFAATARRIKEAGYDGVELGIMSGLLHQAFLSPYYNHRTDEYGGSLENRMRFILESISAMRDAVGPDFVVGVRCVADEFLVGGIAFDEGIEIAKALEAAGQVDYLSTCVGSDGSQYIPSMYYPLAPFTYISAGIKESVNLPVVAAERINDPVLAEGILAMHQADMVAMVRALIADPEMPNKAREGRLEDIRKCIGCNEGCIMRPWTSLPMTCAVNAEVGKEKEMAITLADKKKTVLVVGGGVAGMEAARVAALRGHKVTLCEKEDILAKDLTLAVKAPGRQGWDDARRYFTYQMKALNVDVHLGVTVTPEMVLEEDIDAVVVATGAIPEIPDIPGADGPNVVEMKQVLQEEVGVGEDVVVVALQQHMHGLQMADFLTDQGKRVEILTTAAFAGDRLDGLTLEDIYRRLCSKEVTFTPLTGVKRIEGSKLVTYNVLTHMEKEIEGVDTVVFCTHGKPNDGLYRALKGKVKELYQIGQCVSPRELLDSVHDGAFVGRQL
jgi:2,4-dienoyl-CoA reductase-like NADH-dependent reductase (Old Yellow Enzyme family)/thioredoxin reductase